MPRDNASNIFPELDRVARDRAMTHFTRATERFLFDHEFKRKPRPSRMEMAHNVAYGSAWSMVASIIALTAGGELEGYEFRSEALKLLLIQFEAYAKVILAHKHGREAAPDNHKSAADTDEIANLRKSIGRLYGIVKDMEQRSTQCSGKQ